MPSLKLKSQKPQQGKKRSCSTKTIFLRESQSIEKQEQIANRQNPERRFLNVEEASVRYLKNVGEKYTSTYYPKLFAGTQLI